MDINELKNVVEAALLASTAPISVKQLEQLFDEDAAVTHEALVQTLDALVADCADRGVELVQVASGYRYQIRRNVYPWVSRMWTERPSRYSRAMLETLVLIAYRQPITRGEIEQVRGVVVSSSIVRTLEEREWIRVVGHRDMPGRPALFGTTREFLDYFNLKSLDELPPLSEIRELDDLDPQFDFEQPPKAGVTTLDTVDHDPGDTIQHPSRASEHDADQDTEALRAAGSSSSAATSQDATETMEASDHDAADLDSAAQPPRATADEAEVSALDDPDENDRTRAPHDIKENSA